jgi:hypothetical protein
MEQWTSRALGWLAHSELVQAAANFFGLMAGLLLIFAVVRWVARFIVDAVKTSVVQARRAMVRRFWRRAFANATDLHLFIADVTVTACLAAIYAITAMAWNKPGGRELLFFGAIIWLSFLILDCWRVIVIKGVRSARTRGRYFKVSKLARLLRRH